MEQKNEIRLKQTCFACPEQYDAFLGDKKVGYLRMRYGSFTVEYPECGGECIYTAEPKGYGAFNPEERDYYLNQAKEAINSRIASIEGKEV